MDPTATSGDVYNKIYLIFDVMTTSVLMTSDLPGGTVDLGYGGYPASPTRIIRPSGSLSETLAVRGLEEQSNFPDFLRIIVSCILLCYSRFYVLFFEEFLIHNSRGIVILKNN